MLFILFVKNISKNPFTKTLQKSPPEKNPATPAEGPMSGCHPIEYLLNYAYQPERINPGLNKQPGYKSITPGINPSVVAAHRKRHGL